MKTTLEELQAFIAVVDTHSITAAAAALGQTASGVSRALARLEEKLQTTLLRRTTRRLALTEEGQTFLQRAREIVAAVEQAEEQMVARRQRPAGRLRVDAATPFLLHGIVPHVASYRDSFGSGVCRAQAEFCRSALLGQGLLRLDGGPG
jgi:DNA-binding transcriptional LysR family regulator